MAEKEALYYKKANEEAVQCQLCPHFCAINEGQRGKCGVRENRKGKLYSLVYGKACSMAVDPIEKKPLYHFMPGSKTLSIATAGCNLKCNFCQNWQISQEKPEFIQYKKMMPKQVIEEAMANNCKIIAYTYTEPTIFYEYMLAIAKLARKKGIKNIIVSNGFINPEPLKELCKYIDGANIDLKSFSEKFYQQSCQAKLKPVLESLKILKQNNAWLEITNLLIPRKNDSVIEITNLSNFVKSVDKDIPLHFSAFYPCYNMSESERTPPPTLKKARDIALKSGLKYVYTGNISDTEGSNTFCPKCNKTLIRRQGFYVLANNIRENKCQFCNAKIEGIFSYA